MDSRDLPRLCLLVVLPRMGFLVARQVKRKRDISVYCHPVQETVAHMIRDMIRDVTVL
jgi:hypothetical protein